MADGQTRMTTDIRRFGAEAMVRAGGLIGEGQPVAVPTETVYGLAADARNAAAVARIYVAKGRPDFSPLIVHVADLAAAVARQEAGRLTKVPGIGKKTAERLLLELKGKLADTTSAALPAASDASHDILNALLALGYNEREAAAAMKPLPAGIGTSDGICYALMLLSKS